MKKIILAIGIALVAGIGAAHWYYVPDSERYEVLR